MGVTKNKNIRSSPVRFNYDDEADTVDPTALYKYRAALARMGDGGAFVKIACIGDSTTAGAISHATLGQHRPNSYVSKLAKQMTGDGRPSSSSNAFGNAIGAQGLNLSPGYWDGRLSGSGSFATVYSANIGVGGLLLGNSAAAGTLSFSPGVSTDTVDIYYYDQAAVWTVNINGGATLATITGGSTSTCKKITVSYTAGVHVINIVWVSGAGNIAGFDAYTAGSPEIHMLNLGQGSAQAATLAATTPAFAPINWYKLIAPDLTIISLGINSWINNEPFETYRTSLQTIITNCQLSGDVVLMTPFPSATSQATVDEQRQYVNDMRDLAKINNIHLLDEFANLESKEKMSANGLGADVNHPNGLGHGVIASDVSAFLRQI